MADTIKDTSPEAAEESLLKTLLGETEDDAGSEPDEEPDDSEESEEDENEGDDSFDEPEDSADDDEGDADEEEDDSSEEKEESEQDVKPPKGVSDKTVIFTELDESGKSISVTVEEARAGRLRTADYTRKTQELAAERTAIQAERGQLDEALKGILAMMNGEDAETTPGKLAELARTDPEAATRLRFEREARAEQRAQVEAARKELADRSNKEQVEEAKKVQAAEFAALLRVMPDLKDGAKAKPILTRLTQAAVAVGFTEADMNRIGDHRLMRLLDLAATGLRLSAKKAPTPEPKGTKVPAIAPGVRARSTSGKELAARDAKFRKSRSPDDAADSLMAAMEAASRNKRR